MVTLGPFCPHPKLHTQPVHPMIPYPLPLQQTHTLIAIMQVPALPLSRRLAILLVKSNVADPDPGSGIRCLFDPWI
jgi:hypothetical protein